MKEPSKSPSFDRSLVEGPLTPAIWKIVWPTLLQNVIAGLQGLIDHIMVGQMVGFTGNAAIGVSWQIFLVVVVFVGSLFSGMGVLVARFAGAGDADKVNRVAFQVFLAATFLGLFVFAPVGYFLAPDLLNLVNAQASVQAEALPYLRILFLYSLGMMYFFMLGGALRSAGDARTPLRLGIAVTVLNLVLNVVLIRGLGPIPAFGTKGAAMGTVLANGLIAIFALHRLFTGKWVIRFSTRLGLGPDWQVLKTVLRFGLPTGFQGIAMNLGGVIMIRYVGSLEQSAEAQAAFAIGYTQLFSFVTWTSSALMAASMTITGQNLGAGKPERAVRGPLACTALGYAFVVPIALAFVFLPGTLMGLFGVAENGVLDLGRQLLAYLAVSSLFVTAALSYTGALQGSGDTRSPLYISIFSQLVLPLGLCAVLNQVHQGLEPGDIWLAIVLGHVTRCLLSVGRFQQGKWQDIDVSIDGGSPGRLR